MTVLANKLQGPIWTTSLPYASKKIPGIMMLPSVVGRSRNEIQQAMNNGYRVRTRADRMLQRFTLLEH